MPHGSVHDAVSFELPQVLPQYLDGHSRHASPKFAKSKAAFAEATKDHWFPATFDDADRRVNGTLIAFHMACAGFAHVRHSKPTGYFKVPACERA
jgi:hypothetical protein